MDQVHYQRLRNTRPWREIPGCPGRQVLAGADPELDGWVLAHGVSLPEATSRDPVRLWLLPGGGGVLSYQKPDGRLVHTLGTWEGLSRKCAQWGIDLDAWARMQR